MKKIRSHKTGTNKVRISQMMTQLKNTVKQSGKKRIKSSFLLCNPVNFETQPASHSTNV